MSCQYSYCGKFFMKLSNVIQHFILEESIMSVANMWNYIAISLASFHISV